MFKKLNFISIFFIFYFMINLGIGTNQVNANTYEYIETESINLSNEYVKITVLKSNDQFYLYRLNRNNIIQIIEIDQDGNPLNIYSSDSSFSESKYRSAVTLYYNLNLITDTFYHALDRKGISNDEIRYSNVIISDKISKAIWNGQNIIINPSSSNSIDILAHEYIHSIIQDELGSIGFYGETGAIEESIADIFTTIIDGNFTIGEDTGNIIRSISNPTLYNQPVHYKNYKVLENDKGGVHYNSGIPNYAFFKTYNKLGKEKTYDIYYKFLTEEFDSNETFQSMKKDLMRIAEGHYSKKR